MKQAIESADTKALRKVLSEININITAIRSNAKNFVSNAIVAGQLLSKIKGATKYGDWGGFLESVELTHNTAARYMRLWEHRTAIDLNTVKSLSDAEVMIGQLCDSVSECQGIDKPTSQNEPLTHEKTLSAETKNQPVIGRDENAGGLGGRRTETETPSPVRTDKIQGNNSRPNVTGTARKACAEFSGSEPDLNAYVSDPADKTPKSTPADVAVAREVSEVYPKKVSFELLTREEENSFIIWSQEILVQRETIQPPKKLKIDMRGAVIEVISAYKRVKGRKLSVKPADAAQLRRQLESGTSLEEFIGLAEKAWLGKGFFARQSHQLATFVKHYDNIREEITNPTQSTNGKGNPRLEGVCRDDTINDYGALAAAKSKMVHERAQAELRQQR